MGQTQCSYVYPSGYYSSYGFSNSGNGKSTTPRPAQYLCEFRQFGWLKEASQEEKYTVFYGIAALLFILSLWFLVFKIRHKDFSRTYVMATLAPMTFVAIFMTANQVKEIRDLLGSNITRALLNMAHYTLDATYNLSTIAFLIMNFYAARKRVAVRNDCLVFGIILGISIVYGIICGVFYYLHLSEGIGRILRFIMGCIWLVLLFSLCCCTVPHFDQSSPPVVAHARSRLGWSLLFVFVYCIPNDAIWFNLGSLYRVLDGVIVSIMLIVYFMNPILYCICVILFLPAFRSAFFCSQGSGRVNDIETVKPVKNQAPKIQVPAPARVTPNLQDFGVRDGFYGQAETIPMTHLPGQPVPPPQQNYRYQQHHADYQHGQPLSVPFPMTPNLAVSHQPTYMFPSNALPVEQYQVIQPSVVTQQHTVASQPVILSQPHVMTPPVSHQVVSTPMVQSNLVRFASQPNLIQMSNLQTAASTPHLNLVTQSPFYIQG